jgi:hypothetical protein
MLWLDSLMSIDEQDHEQERRLVPVRPDPEGHPPTARFAPSSSIL